MTSDRKPAQPADRVGLEGAATTWRLVFWCPGCEMTHRIPVRDAPGAWTWNGSVERPTLSPSILRYPPGNGGDERMTPRCHAFVTDGRIQFLMDCDHALKGQIVDLPSWALHEAGRSR